MTGGRVRVRFEPSGRELWARPGERVLDAAEEVGLVALPLACRAGNCGACLVNVPRGEQCLQAAGPAEAQTLAALAARPGQRLGCQVRLRGDAPDDACVVLAAARAPAGAGSRRGPAS